MEDVAADDGAWVRLWWIPLGAGGPAVVRVSGRTYEAVAAGWAGRERCALHHCALEVRGPDRWVPVEIAPAWGERSGVAVAATGPVGSPVLGRSRAFRYEVRCGTPIPDVAWATVRLDVPSDGRRAAALLRLVPRVPTFTWGRRVAGTTEMWNSNSAVAWLLAGSGHDVERLGPPDGCRAPGWDAGWQVARFGAAVAPGDPGRPGGWVH